MLLVKPLGYTILIFALPLMILDLSPPNTESAKIITVENANLPLSVVVKPYVKNVKVLKLQAIIGVELNT